MAELTALTADAAPTGDDLIYVVNDPAGTPADRKVTITNLAASAPFSALYTPTTPTGTVLAVVKNTAGGNKSTTSATLADVDATNALITFTAPASGKVLVRVTVTGSIGAVNTNTFLGLREGTTNLVNGTTGTLFMQGQTATAQTELTLSWCAYLTGITAGSHTYKVAFATNGGTFTLRAAAATPMTIEVAAAP